MDPFLAPNAWVDSDDAAIVALAGELRHGAKDDVDVARRAFEWVRDEVRHAGDHRASPTTCRASEVLRERQGWCYAKAHLLAALLRASGIRAALCYQRLDVGGRVGLHGLVAVDLPAVGWYRVDPRGNKPGVHADFAPPVERLAFALAPGEEDLPGLHAEPLPEVVSCLTAHASWDAVLAHLPDAGTPLLRGQQS